MLILVRYVQVVASKGGEKSCSRALENLLQPIMSTKSFPHDKKTRPGRPKRSPGRLHGAPRRPQDASKTPPGRFPGGFKPFRKRGCFLFRFPDPKITPKWLPKPLQDALRTPLETMSIQTDRAAERHRDRYSTPPPSTFNIQARWRKLRTIT